MSTRMDRVFDFFLGGLQRIVRDVDSSILDAHFLNPADRVQCVRDCLLTGRRTHALALDTGHMVATNAAQFLAVSSLTHQSSKPSSELTTPMRALKADARSKA